MAYATSTDLAQVGLSATLTASVPGGDITAALDRASSWCDGYLRKAYTLPIVGTTGDLTRAVCMIAAWDILSAQVGFDPESAQNGVWRLRYEDAIRWLTDVAAGRIDAGLTDSTASTDENAPGVYTTEARGW